MRKLFSMAVLSACLSLSVTPVHASGDLAPAAPAAISPAKQALLVRLDKAMDFEKLINQSTQAAMTSAMDGMRQIFPEMTAEQTKIMSEAVSGVAQKYTPKMKEVTFAAYGEILNEAELTAMVEFYESPEGRAILKKVPEINQRAIAGMSQMNVQMQKEMIVAMCGKMECPQSLKDRLK